MKTKLETSSGTGGVKPREGHALLRGIAVVLLLAAISTNGTENDWADIARRQSGLLSEEETIQRATKVFVESTLVRAMRSAGPPMPPPIAAAPALPENTWLVNWDIGPSTTLSSKGVYVLMYGQSLVSLTNYIVTTSGTNSAQIVHEPGVRYYWAVVAVSDEGVMSEKLFNEHRWPLAYERRYVALESQSFSGPRAPIATNVITATNPIGFLWGEMTSTIIP